MKKKLLFIAPDYYGFSDVVLDGLKKYSEYEVTYLNSSAKYQYKHFGERIYNFFLKTFCNKNLKTIKQGEHIERIISQTQYDILLVIGAYVLSEKNLQLALQKAPYSITIFWDSMEKIPMQKEQIELFDTCYSFDKDDCQKYNLKAITNFYFIEETSKNEDFDVSYLATYDHRVGETIRIFEYFQENGIKAKAKYFCYPSHPVQEKLPSNIEVIHKIIPFKQSHQYYLDSKVILDIAHSHQRGLSFRPFEAMGMNKKLITTNKDIVNYDFYNPNNIFVIENVENIHIPKSFFETDYQEISAEIKEKYHIKNWIKRMLYDY